MIDLKQATISLKGKTLFENIDLCFESNVNYVIQGANGSGKTTLLKLIAGNILPKSGQVSYSFIDSALAWERQYDMRKKYVHLVPVHALHELIGGSNLYYQQRYYSIGDTNIARVRDYFGASLENLKHFHFPESLSIDSLLDLELTRLSNGQVKKVVIIRQLLRNIPKVLLLDYPFEGLDVESRLALSGFLDHLAINQEIQIILTDHYHALPKCITKRIILENFKIKTIESFRASSRAFNRPSGLHASQKSESPALVEIKDLRIQYGNKVIIDNLTWRINKGERWALTGKNGSGKTTIFSLIFADHPIAYSQNVNLFGKRRGSGESIWDIKKRINYLGPEQIHFLNVTNSPLTVREYLSDQSPEAEDNARTNLISFFSAQKLMQNQMRHLSSGELQLVLLLGVFLSKKELLLLDEPFQFLDQQQKEKVSDYLNNYLDASATLVLITHYEADIEKWTNHRLHL